MTAERHSSLRLVEAREDAGASAEPLWGVDEVCAFLRRKKTWVYEQCARRVKGGLPHRRLGGLRFVPAEVRAWVAGQPVTVPTSGSKKKTRG